MQCTVFFLGVVKQLVCLWFNSKNSGRLDGIVGDSVKKGDHQLLMNQLMLLDLMKSLSDHGPLWSSSLFVFEDWNEDVRNYFHGMLSVPSQVKEKLTLLRDSENHKLYFNVECSFTGNKMNDHDCCHISPTPPRK